MENSYEEKSYVTRKEVLTYGVSNGGQIIGYALVSSYLTYFYINVFHVDPKIISVIFFIGGIWDIINNPMMGIVIDHKNSAEGRLCYFLKRFTPPLGVATIFLFLAPYLIHNTSPVAPSKIIYIIISYFIWELFYTITDVAYGGLSAAISPSPLDRQRLITASNICMQLGTSIVFVIMPVMLDLSAKNKVNISMQEVFLILGLLAGLVGVGLFSLAGFFSKERVRQSLKQPSVQEIISAVVHNRPLLLLMLSELIITFSSVGNALSTYYYIDVLGYASLSIVVAAPGLLVSFFSYSMISCFKKRLDNKQIYILALILVSSVEFISFLIGLRFYSEIKVMLPLLIVTNCLTALLSGTLNVIPAELLAEVTDYTEWKMGLRNEGINFSIRNSTYKINGTIAQAIAALILGSIGYVAATGDVRAVQTEEVKKGLWIAFSFIPVLMYLFGIIPMLFYDLVGEKRERMFKELEERRSRQKQEEK